jgi:hypothetical protein
VKGRTEKLTPSSFPTHFTFTTLVATVTDRAQRRVTVKKIVLKIKKKRGGRSSLKKGGWITLGDGTDRQYTKATLSTRTHHHKFTNIPVNATPQSGETD